MKPSSGKVDNMFQSNFTLYKLVKYPSLNTNFHSGTSHTYCMSKKPWPILFSKKLRLLGHTVFNNSDLQQRIGIWASYVITKRFWQYFWFRSNVMNFRVFIFFWTSFNCMLAWNPVENGQIVTGLFCEISYFAIRYNLAGLEQNYPAT